ncbi:hypothetical protein KIH86_09635 [Paenibacillus sp. HN-1]|uniref:hypothetical protein n=1 Tax=Paenibacillus TaxID=44249 RepID=UPI001CA9AA9B|nr:MULTISPECIES: hypothetical protein [Paenibacillus]MBY9079849.1 hypothetical protein [Paenibacillus sp. CGMCC 1.18879]MBY9084490.1 hypothetical protein [Paenibacillus sinensis]
MIRSNPYAPEILAGYKKRLRDIHFTYKAATHQQKNQLQLKIELLNYMINIYSIGTDPHISTGEQFRKAYRHNFQIMAVSKPGQPIAAFTKTFGVAAFILLLSSFAGLFTDRKKIIKAAPSTADHPVR